MSYSITNTLYQNINLRLLLPLQHEHSYIRTMLAECVQNTEIVRLNAIKYHNNFKKFLTLPNTGLAKQQSSARAQEN